MSALAMAVLCVTAPLGDSTAIHDPIGSLQPAPIVERRHAATYQMGPQEISLSLFDKCVKDAALKPYGTSGTWRWNVSTGGAFDLRSSRNRLYQGGAGVSYFAVDTLSLDAEINLIYFDQAGSDAVGANINIFFRHHIIMGDTWSLYLDAGAGLLGTTERVPEDGTRFNFLPHAGGGMSFDVAWNVRLLTGVRWHHISNANTARHNPGRDSLLAYIALSFPF